MTGGADRARVLVVDDDRFQRELVRDVLADRAEVQTCADADEALRALSRGPVDLLLPDLSMRERFLREPGTLESLIVNLKLVVEQRVPTLADDQMHDGAALEESEGAGDGCGLCRHAWRTWCGCAPRQCGWARWPECGVTQSGDRAIPGARPVLGCSWWGPS